MADLSDDVGGDHEVVREAGLDHVGPGGAGHGGGHLGVERQTGGWRHLVRAGTEEAGQDDVEPLDEALLPRLHQGRQGARPGLAAPSHPGSDWLTPGPRQKHYK